MNEGMAVEMVGRLEVKANLEKVTRKETEDWVWFEDP